MFDIGFFELLLISIVGLLVFGPEQFLDAVRTTLHWIKKFRRSVDDVRLEVQRELHNDEILKQLKDSASELEHEIRDVAAPVTEKMAAIEQEVQAEIQPSSDSGTNANKPVESRVDPS
ncbi:Sec-independent protein translocase protein TatB [Luminiphilus sp.]|nr:Sec-independent protein translocase protein TatB [Luminiphilus sp.]MDA8825899.1 Sec-independent protein translocase protein TatB [Luminiphilus sp.]MDA9580729.1 Sec-independent protein translocase protein TatB [Luminiphilus sp.]MDB2352310.1 Sec-independent protein translocase protein TatB [Luminiphilus sp.]MDB2615872.1 Sec-independent protein translocase protein TatB [Luminiphilus sp.]